MAWAKFDDRWATHPKLLSAGLEAKGLDASGICWSAGQETDGFVPDSAVVALCCGHRHPKKVADRLVEVGRWARDDDRKGYVIHDFDRYNFTRDQGEAKRKSEAERKAEYRKRQGRDAQGRITSNGVVPPGQVGDKCPTVPTGHLDNSVPPVPPVPTRPDPTRPVMNDLDPSPNHHGVGPPSATDENDEDDENEPPDPLVERLASLWPGRIRMLAESKSVISRCRQVADEGLIDECIGAMLSLDGPPSTPRYLLSTLLNRLVSGGAYTASDPRLEVLHIFRLRSVPA